MSLRIAPMSRADLDLALGWAREEGWNPGLDDADAFHAQDPSGFLMGWLGGEPIGCISVVKYGDAFAFLGLYIVRPDWRGQGHGKAIWDAGIASAGSRTIGLDGVVAQQANYRRSGFVLAHSSARWSGIVDASADARIRAVTPDLIPAIEALDRSCFPAPRPAFLAHWLGGATRTSLCLIEDGAILGYGTIRRAIDGAKVGPLFARTPEIVAALLAALAAEAPDGRIVIDVPATNAAATALVTCIGMQPGFETARMYRGPAPALDHASIFAITTLELG